MLTLTNIQSGLCIQLLAALLRLFTSFNAGRITDLRDLLNEMSTVTQWYLLGIYLGVDLSILATIKADHKDTKDCRTHTLIEWWNRATPTWSAVVKALMGIGREKLASQVAEKHGMNIYLELLAYQLSVTHRNGILLLFVYRSPPSRPC